MVWTVEELLAGRRRDLVEVVLALRDLVRKTVPDAEERVQKGWGVISYFDPRMLLYIGPAREFVYFGFCRGVELDDPKGLLQGTGKYMRHAKLYPGEDLPITALRKLIVQAHALARRDAAPGKLALRARAAGGQRI